MSAENETAGQARGGPGAAADPAGNRAVAARGLATRARDRGDVVRAGILRTYVATLRLRRDAPFPSQIRARQRYRMAGRR